MSDTQMSSALGAGLDTLSLGQTITFVKYNRLVLPLDGYVFWVRSNLSVPDALIGAAPYDQAIYDFGPTVTVPGLPPGPVTTEAQAAIAGVDTITAKGSIHYATDGREEQNTSQSRNQIVFTTQTDIVDLNADNPGVLWIGTWEGVRFAFSQRKNFYVQAGLRHYAGTAILPIMESQIIDDPLVIDTQNVIVSNSLPIWLAMAQAAPPFPISPIQPLTLFPSFVIPPNLTPPYGSVHIAPNSTQPLQAAPVLDPATSSRYQLVQEEVEITIFGFRNFNAIDFCDFVVDYGFFTESFGVMNIPIVRDFKNPQVEIQALAMEKRITFQINYYQTRMRQIAMQYITSCVPSVTFN